jgi:hypothetical protein
MALEEKEVPGLGAFPLRQRQEEKEKARRVRRAFD